MKEDFLHFIWRFKKFDFLSLRTINNEPLSIINFGNYNTDAGPDFQNGKIKIGETEWAGHIEMHINASDWNRHKHSKNKDYNNVVLHVVWESDATIKNNNQQVIPCLILKDRVKKELLYTYQNIINSQNWIPCANQIKIVESIKIRSWLEHLMVARLEEKTTIIKGLLKEANSNWEQVLFILFAKVMGLKVNTDNFEILATSIPVNLLYKHRDNLTKLESILFGQAGMLQKKRKDEYSKSLLKEYVFLSKKYSLKKPSFLNWKLARLRPANFPTIRISQLAKLYYQSNFSFDVLIEKTPKEILHLFKNLTASDYWDDHYLFEKELEKTKQKKMGSSRIQLLIINALVPILFIYGKERADQRYIDKSLELLTLLPSEKNKIISNWNQLGIKASTAFDSQALIHLKTRYCSKFKCLQCAIGNRIMQA